MLTLIFHDSNDIRVDTVPDPVLQQSDDVILKNTAAAICDSDLHLYRCKIPVVKAGDILGHEFMGTVIGTGCDVSVLKKVIGSSFHSSLRVATVFSARKKFATCETTNPDRGAI